MGGKRMRESAPMTERAFTYLGAVLLALLLAHAVAYHLGQMRRAVSERWETTARTVLR
jgi:hypothetical protein